MDAELNANEITRVEERQVLRRRSRMQKIVEYI
jgi:hypothetical protein